MNLSSYDSATGVVTGTITHLHIAYSGNGCTAAIDGTGGTANNGRVRLRYADSTGQLTIRTAGGNLHWYDVSNGCLGIVQSRDPATLRGIYAVAPEQTITSPETEARLQLRHEPLASPGRLSSQPSRTYPQLLAIGGI